MTTAISINEAKQRLGEMADRAIKGERIVIVRRSKLLVLEPIDGSPKVQMPPPGYFDDCYDQAAVAESNKLAALVMRRV